jgi:glycosyltransferase involved in cell wall biosynthesis
MTPAVSVIIPCHNGGRFLDALMGSLANQTFRDFEVVIVNDGSNDPFTLTKLDVLRSKVRVIDQTNRYLPGARNTGYREARAEFVLPLDCDDLLEPEYISETVAALRQAPDDVGFAFTHMRLTGALEGILNCRFNAFEQLFINRLPYCMLIRKSAWARVGGYDEAMRDGMEDWEFNIHLSEAGYRGVEIPKPLFVYAVRHDGMLLSKSAHLQGTIWRYIRTKHRDLYRLPSLIARLRTSQFGWRQLLVPLALIVSAKTLPDSWFNSLFFRLMMLARKWRGARGTCALSAPPMPERGDHSGRRTVASSSGR